MKKTLLFAVLAATVGLTTSCSEDDLTSNSGVDANTIAFATKSSGMQTRSGMTLTELDKFTVTANNADKTTFFTDQLFNYDAATSIFKSATPYYWQIGGALSFYAINEPGTKSLNSDNVPQYTYTNWGAETDLVAATVLAGTKTIPYPLTFQHLTSQVRITATPTDKTEELTYKLLSVKMVAPSTGTYSFADATGGKGSWVIDNAQTKEYSYDSAMPISFTQSGSANPSSVYWNILPVTDGKIDFTVEYQVYQNGQMIADFSGTNAKVCSAASPNLQMGKKYIYNFLLTRDTEDVITFTTTVNSWEDGDTYDEQIYNPALTYVTYLDGTTKSFDISGSIAVDEVTAYLDPSTIIDDVKNAVEVKIGNKVTELGYKAFAGCRNLKKIDIPSSVTKIGTYAFGDTPALAEVNFSEGLLEIGDKAFSYQNGYYCGTNLTHIEFPSSLTRIGKYAFAGSLRLTELEIPAGIYLDNCSFYGCNNLESLVISEGCTFAANAFQQNVQTRYNNQITTPTTSLKTVEFTGKVNFEGQAVFWGCTNLTTIKYNSTELPSFTGIADTYNVWSSTTATNAVGYNTREDGTNMFYVPSTATFTEDDLDVMKPVLFDTEYCGFTFSKTL